MYFYLKQAKVWNTKVSFPHNQSVHEGVKPYKPQWLANEDILIAHKSNAVI